MLRATTCSDHSQQMHTSTSQQKELREQGYRR
jgi:hypothetical protein